MKKIFLMLTVFLILVLLFSVVYAQEVNFNPDQEEEIENENLENEEVTDEPESTAESVSTTGSQYQPPVQTTTTTTTSDDANNPLTLENILSIILIVIGLLLIFLAIAIIIRCKK